MDSISNVKLDIAPRTNDFFSKRNISPNMNHIPQARALEHDDSLRLVVEAFNTTIHLHLAPNHELFHPNAVFHQDGQSTFLKPSDFRVYRGYVVEGIYSEHWWISNIKNIDDMKHQPGTIGWARIIIRNDIK